MSKEATRARIVKQSMKNQEKYESKLMSLIDQIDSQKNIISDAGKGSRRANTAQKKIDSIRKKLDKLADKKHHDISRIIKDKDLVETLNITNDTIEQYLIEINKPAATGYSTSNIVDTRTLDGSTATLANVIDVFGTLIENLKGKGLLDD